MSLAADAGVSTKAGQIDMLHTGDEAKNLPRAGTSAISSGASASAGA